MTSPDELSNNLSYYSQWAFGLLFLLTGLGFFAKSIISGIITIAVGFFLIPKVRESVLDSFEFELPKYAVPAVVIVGMAISGGFLPSDPAPQYEVVSQDLGLQIDNESQTVVVSGTAQVENTGDASGTYLVGLYREGRKVENVSKTIKPNETASFELSYTVTESGTHSAELRSSTSGDLDFSGNDDGEFTVSENIDVPYVLTDQSTRSLIEDKADYGLGSTDIHRISDVSIGGVGNFTTISVYNRGEAYWDNNDIFKTGVANSYAISRVIFENFEEVDEVVSFTKANSTDQYGNTESSTAVKIAVSRETAQKVNWEGIQDRIIGDYSHWLEVSDRYKIQYNLCQEVELRTCSK
ncbi:hypothetical protein [Candidatus Nanohalovita haloferacivicina]|uniref:hypothetical protein n=1 Tax=Candidatus Nanohalovita haloferacivicina TaxID=2978046 RepID=UPI00325FD647